MTNFSLMDHDISIVKVYRNLPPSSLYEHAIRYEKDARIAENGALVAYSGAKTGRSPQDKRIVKHPASEGVSDEEQRRRFEARINDPLRQWKLSPMDLASRSKWFEYSRARDRMFEATDSRWAPWHILRAEDKKRARLNCISHLLTLIPCKKVRREKAMLPERS